MLNDQLGMSQPQPTSGQNNTTRNIIIAVVVGAVVLCCCCVAVLVPFLWACGDLLVGASQYCGF